MHRVALATLVTLYRFPAPPPPHSEALGEHRSDAVVADRAKLPTNIEVEKAKRETGAGR